MEADVLEKDLKNEIFYSEQLTEKNQKLTKRIRDSRDAQ